MNGRIKREVKKEKIAIIGNIKVGRKKDNGLPESLDYFIADSKYKAHFDREFPEKPRSIEIVFLSDNIEDVCFERYEIRQGAKLFGYGNGFDFFVWDEKTIDPVTGQFGAYAHKTIENDPDIKEKVAKQVDGKWDEVLTMRFLIPRIKGIWGVWQLSTKGAQSSIPEIIGVFDAIQQRAGTVKNLAFDLSVKKVKSQKPGTKSLFPVLQLVPNLSHENLQKVHDFLDNGIEFRGILTEEAIEQIEAEQPLIEAHGKEVAEKQDAPIRTQGGLSAVKWDAVSMALDKMEQAVQPSIESFEKEATEKQNDSMRIQMGLSAEKWGVICMALENMPKKVKDYFFVNNMAIDSQYEFCKKRNGDEKLMLDDIQALEVAAQFAKEA